VTLRCCLLQSQIASNGHKPPFAKADHEALGSDCGQEFRDEISMKRTLEKRTSNIFFTSLIGAFFIFFHVHSQAAQSQAITLSPLKLCEAPSETCVPRIYKTNVWQGCNKEPEGCYLKAFEMTLPKGDAVQIVGRDRAGAWIKVVARWCTSTCKETFSGWLRRQDIAYLAEFRRLTSWSAEEKFQIEAGDYAEEFHVRKDGRFKIADRQGTMFFYGDVIWARLRKAPNSTEFLFIPVKGDKHCWTENPEEDVYGDERWNCFSSPFND
jgi:hypothetical protein